MYFKYVSKHTGKVFRTLLLISVSFSLRFNFQFQ